MNKASTKGADALRFSAVYDTDLGPVRITSNGRGITSLQPEQRQPGGAEQAPDQWTDLAARQLQEYLAGQRQTFQLPLCPQGTPFRQQVWEALGTIPYGETRSYRQVAEALGKPGASRAVGMANRHNPIWIVIPCHRVVGSGGALVGYAGGLEMKRNLLDLEARHR